MLRDFFEKDQPLEVEMGCGKGKFLVARAAAHPERNFLGIDKAGRWLKRGVRRVERLGFTNLHFCKREVREFLEKEVPNESVAIFHLYFPDPWPKRRHHKRRLFTSDFLKKLNASLQPGGLIEVATDFEDYYQWMLQVLEETPLSWREVRHSVNERLFEAVDKTNYEIKYEAQGKNLYYLELQKG